MYVLRTHSLSHIHTHLHNIQSEHIEFVEEVKKNRALKKKTTSHVFIYGIKSQTHEEKKITHI